MTPAESRYWALVLNLLPSVTSVDVAVSIGAKVRGETLRFTDEETAAIQAAEAAMPVE
jgi:hypothetical protein